MGSLRKFHVPSQRIFVVLLLLSGLVFLAPTRAISQSSDMPFLPQLLEPIQPDNAQELKLLGVLGRGRVEKVLWVDANLVVSTDIGIWLYDANNLHGLPRRLTHQYSGDMVAIMNGLLMAASYESDASVAIRFWDTEQFNEIKSIVDFQYGPTAVAISPASPRVVAVASTAGVVTVIDFDSTAQLYQLPCGWASWVDNILAFSPDGSLLACGGYDAILRVWNIQTGVEIVGIEMSKSVGNVAFSPDGQLLAAALGDPYGNFPGVDTLHVWRVSDLALGSNLKEVYVFPTPGGFIEDIRFSPDGRLLASVGRVIQLWDIETYKLHSTLQDDRTYFRSIAFNPDSTQIATGNGDGSLRYWDVETSQELVRIEEHGDSASVIAFTPDSGNLLTANELYVDEWNITQGELSRRIYIEQPDLSGTFRARSFSPDTSLLATATANDRFIIWDITGDYLKGLSRFRYPMQQPTIMKITFRSDGRAIALAVDGVVYMDNIYTGIRKSFLSIDEQPFYEVVFHPSGTRLAASGPGGVVLIDITTGNQVLLDTQSQDIKFLTFSLDGSNLAYTTGGGNGLDEDVIHVWDIDQRQELLTINSGEKMINNLVYNPFGNVIATDVYGYTLKLWDASTGEELITLNQDYYEYYRSTVFSPDGRLLASVTGGGTVYLWGIPTPTEN